MSSIQGRFLGMFGAFFLLIIVSAGLTFWGVDAQKQDAQTINLAGRQRMLTQQLARLALEYQQEGDDRYLSDLKNTANTFDLTLETLRKGGNLVDYSGRAVQINPPEDANLTRELNILSQQWTALRNTFGALGRKDPVQQAVVLSIENSAPQLVTQVDRVVSIYEELSSVKISRLHWIQASFLFCGFMLLGLGWWQTRRSVVLPLDLLDRSARQIGAGDLDSPVNVSGPVEIEVLGRTMETMRSQLMASHIELSQWVDTLEQRVHQRTRELEALSAVSQDITSRLSITEVLKSVTAKAQELMGSDVALLCMLDSEGRSLNLHSTAAAAPIQMEVRKRGRPYILRDRTPAQPLEPGSAVQCSSAGCPGFCGILDPEFRASHLAAPLHSDGKVIGALCVGSSQAGQFNRELEKALTQLAEVATVALENSRLFEQAEHGAILEERQRIASEMHDGLLQTLSFLRWMVRLSAGELIQGNHGRALEMLDKIERGHNQAEIEIRRAIASMQENFPTRYTLQDQLAAIVKEQQETCTFLTWENQVSQPVLMGRSENEQVLRVAREALLNAIHHSQASSIQVRFEQCGEQLVLSVSDNGVGFTGGLEPAPGAVNGSANHFGLKIMRARAARLGADLEVNSILGQGTSMELRWPFLGSISEGIDL